MGPLSNAEHRTLVKGGNTAHVDAYSHALRTIYGLPRARRTDIHYAGKVDRQIILETALLHGVPEHRAKALMDEAMRAMATYYAEHKDEGESCALPGVAQLLAELKGQGVPLGLLTGNVESIGWGKVEQAGLGGYFTFGAFGDAVYERVQLLTIARERAEQALHREVLPTEFVIVGDTPLDVACAKAEGVGAIAVATGQYSRHDLESTEPDVVLSTLEDTKTFLGALSH